MTAVTSTPPSARWPYAGVGQKHLLVAAAFVVFGSVLPWVMTPFGNLQGTGGAGLWTLTFGALGIPGAILRRRRVVFWHAAAVAVPAVALPAWQLARLVELNLLAGTFGAALPGIGLVLTLVGGGLAARAAWRLSR